MTIEEKKVKAFDIIAIKGINLHMFKICDDLSEYNKLRNTAGELTQEEYNLFVELLK